MPIYKLKSQDGRTVQVRGETPPSEIDADEIFQNVPFEGMTSAGKKFSYPKVDLERKILPQFFTGLAESDLPFAKEASSGLPVRPESMPRPKGFLPTLARGAGNVAPDLAMSVPFMRGAGLIPKLLPILKSGVGFGAYSGTKAALKGESPSDIAKETAKGAGSAMLFHGAGKVGASVLPRALPGASRIGSSLAGGVVGGITGNGEGAILGAGLGALYPSERFKGKAPSKYAQEAIQEYRTILRPEKGEIQNIEIKKGQNIDDYYKLAAEEGLTFKQSGDKGSRKLDTEESRLKLQDKISGVDKELELRMSRAKPVQIDLEQIRASAKQEMRDLFKNDLEYKEAIKDVDDYINASVENNGSVVDGLTANKIKQGMWSAGYNALKPTANKTSRKIGFVLKEAIQKAYPNSDIQALNERMGKFLTLQSLLKNAHGRVVKGGAIGRYVASGVGALAGSWIPLVGPIAGGIEGARAGDYIASPERMSKIAARKAVKGGLKPSTLKLNPEFLSRELPYGPKRIGSMRPETVERMQREVQPMIRRASPPMESLPKEAQIEFAPRVSEYEKAFERAPILGEGFTAVPKDVGQETLARQRMETIKRAIEANRGRLGSIGEALMRRFRVGD